MHGNSLPSPFLIQLDIQKLKMSTLTRNYILAKTKKSDLKDVKHLNIWGSELRDVSILKELVNVEVLSLSVNSINSLSDFAQCHALTEIYLRKNAITDLREVVYLRGLRNLSVLWLCENPIAEHPQYRSYIIKALPQLKRLDDVDITQAEIQEAARTRFTVPIELPSNATSAGAAPSMQPPRRYSQQPQDNQAQPAAGYQERSPTNQRRQGWGEPAHPTPQERDSRPYQANRQSSGPNLSRGSQHVMTAIISLLNELDSTQLESVKSTISAMLSKR